MADADGLARLLDEQAIKAVLTRYSRGLDRCDEELLRSCYFRDSTDDHGWFKGTGLEFVKLIIERYRGGPITQHAISNVSIEFDGDRAFVETYVQMRTLDGDGAQVLGWGRYVDVFERRVGEWRIASRTVVLEGTPPGFDLAQFAQATQDRNDLSYRR